MRVVSWEKMVERFALQIPVWFFLIPMILLRFTYLGSDWRGRLVLTLVAAMGAVLLGMLGGVYTIFAKDPSKAMIGNTKDKEKIRIVGGLGMIVLGLLALLYWAIPLCVDMQLLLIRGASLRVTSGVVQARHTAMGTFFIGQTADYTTFDGEKRSDEMWFPPLIFRQGDAYEFLLAPYSEQIIRARRLTPREAEELRRKSGTQ